MKGARGCERVSLPVGLQNPIKVRGIPRVVGIASRARRENSGTSALRRFIAKCGSCAYISGIYFRQSVIPLTRFSRFQRVYFGPSSIPRLHGRRPSRVHFVRREISTKVARESVLDSFTCCKCAETRSTDDRADNYIYVKALYIV